MPMKGQLSQEKLATLLQASSLFEEWSEQERMAFVAKDLMGTWGGVRRYDEGQIIFMHESSCEYMGVVLEGAVSVERIDAQGNQLLVATMTLGDSFGANLLFATKPFFPMTVLAAKPTWVLLLHRDCVLDLMRDKPVFLRSFLALLSDRTVVLSEKIHEIALRSIRDQVLMYLKAASERQGSRRVVLEVSKKELASRFGIWRTSLSRELDKMRREGLIEYDARTITLLEKGLHHTRD